MNQLCAADEPVIEDDDEELTFRLEPLVGPTDPNVVRPSPAGVQPSSPEAAGAPEEPAAVPPVVSPGPAGPAEEAPRKEPMKIVKLRVPASMHAQIVALMNSLGCVNESQVYRQVLYTGLKHTKRSR